MMVLGVSGLANIPFAALLSMLIPLLIGMLWGNLDERFKQLCAAGAAAGDHYYVVRHRRQLQYQSRCSPPGCPGSCWGLSPR